MCEKLYVRSQLSYHGPSTTLHVQNSAPGIPYAGL